MKKICSTYKNGVLTTFALMRLLLCFISFLLITKEFLLIFVQNRIMSVSEIKLYNLLRTKVGEEQAQNLVEFIQSSVKDEFDTKKEIFATKEDLTREISNLRADLLKTIYLVGIVQFVGIVGSLLAILKFMK